MRKYYVEKRPNLCNDCAFYNLKISECIYKGECKLKAFENVVTGERTKHIRPENCPLHELSEYITKESQRAKEFEYDLSRSHHELERLCFVQQDNETLRHQMCVLNNSNNILYEIMKSQEEEIRKLKGEPING